MDVEYKGVSAGVQAPVSESRCQTWRPGEKNYFIQIAKNSAF